MNDPTESTEPERLRRTGERIDRLLEEVASLVTPPVQQRIDQVMHGLLDLYGAGLARLLDIGARSGASAAQLQAGILADELVSSLLLLHGLHPLPPADRIRRALERTRAVLDAQGLAAELAGIDGNQVVQLRIVGGNDGRARQPGAIRAALMKSVEEAAPEATAIVIEGLPESEHGPHLVQLRAHPAAQTQVAP